MKRREFLMMAATGASLSVPRVFGALPACGGTSSQLDARATAPDNRGQLLILIELKGGNDGLNTVVPFADSAYYTLRKHIAIARDRAIALDERTALHPALRGLLPIWQSGRLAVVQGVGCAQDNPSHFRSMEVWDTAARANVYRRDGWLTRALDHWPATRPRIVTASFGCVEAGPFAGLPANEGRGDAWARVADPDDAPYVDGMDADPGAGDPVSRDAPDASRVLSHDARGFRESIEAALRTVVDAASPDACGAIRLTLDGFDTHGNQPARHAALLGELAHGCATLQAELMRRGRWDRTLIMTYSEFGRSAHENANRGTAHGGAAAHFMMGGPVRGGLYGAAPDLTRLDADGRLPVAIDFRRLYATALGPFLRLDAIAVLEDDVKPLPLLRA
ncbi:DUF1501 domain-containing protein [Paraburkholderia sp. LEh10]|uniref:DUF1501 domain-containing protein n=1 Tax=Paraburkholderia sp. LEh10 TaxID=2821353 RepID=UPI001AE5A64F|nr:DUF1501 domain-containing protein [Paraburkholderia sp. LEh10]MBP0594473.1 DUF1501 domain-containing protein [Paraburkholderia sp. LEh10]